MNFKKIILKNGLRLVLVPEKSSLATTVLVLVEAGSEYEMKETSGISHFLEHMCFKGTKKRPRPSDIASYFDGLGAEYNAFTSQEYTGYFAKAANDKSDEILEAVTDLYLNPVLDRQEIEKEKGVIVQEINMYEDSPQSKVHENFMELVYGDQPAGWNVAGRKETVNKISRETLLKYRGEHYLPQSTIVVIAGGFDQKKTVKNVEKYFGKLARGAKGVKAETKENQKNPAELVTFKECDQTHLVMGFRAFDIFDKRRFASKVLANILGGGMSSRLFQKVREEMGAAYYVYAMSDLSMDHGIIAMGAGVEHGKLEKVISASLAEFTRLKMEKVSPVELKKAKESLMGRLLLSVETSDEMSSFYGSQEITGLKLETPQEIVKKIKAVTAADIQKVARDIFTEDRLNLALIGPFKNKSFKDILRMSKP